MSQRDPQAERLLLHGSPTAALDLDALVARVAPSIALRLGTPDASPDPIA